MPRDISPLGPQPQNPGPKPSNGVNSDKKGGGGAGGRRREKDEPEPDELDEEEAEAQLTGDSLATHRQAALGDFPEQMPWEQSAEARKKRLEELAKRRGGTPPAATGTSKLALPANPPRPTLGTPKPPVAPTPTNKRLQAGWDPNAAANNTLMAHNTLREQLEERRRQEAERAKQAEQAKSIAAPLGFEALAKPAEQPKEAPLAPSSQPPLDPPSAPASSAPLAAPSTGKLPPTAKAPTGNLPNAGAPPQAPAVPPRNTGGLAAPPPQRQTGPLPQAKSAPLPHREAPVAQPAPQPEAPVAKPTPKPEPPVAPPTAQPAAPPTIEKVVPKAPVRQAGRYRCMYQVLDVTSREPIKGARLEFEPTHDTMLPVVNGVSDEWGVYCSNDPPPGYYQVTVRFPGYVPMTQTRYIVDGETDEGTFMIRKP